MNPKHIYYYSLERADVVLSLQWKWCDGSRVCFVQNTLSAIGEPLTSLVFQPLLRRKQVVGFLEEEVRYPKESLASLTHLVFVHHLAADTFPCVFR